MKTFFSLLLAFAVISAMALPFVASAQSGPIECCKIRRAIVIDGTETCTTGQYAGPVGYACPITTPSTTVNCPTRALAGSVIGSEKWGLFCTLNTINAVVDWIFTIMVVGAVLLVIMGAVSLMTAAGDPTKVTEGRNYILYAAIGLLVAFIARAVPSLVSAILGY